MLGPFRIAVSVAQATKADAHAKHLHDAAVHDFVRAYAQIGKPDKARAAFQRFRRRYDEAIFGAGACSAEEYAALLRDAEPMLARAGAS